jgi:hypothetical protein
MSQFKDDEFKFPDEIENEPEQKIEIEIENDIPEEDRVNAAPLPREIAQDVENDDLEAYSQEAKERLLQMKKLMHDERRLKDEAMREHKEAIRVANLVIEENKRLKGRLSDGEKVYVHTAKESITRELEMAKRELKEAYESGDSDRMTDAQERLTEVKFKSQEMERYRPQYEENALQSEQDNVKISTPQSQPQRMDSKTQAWLDKNKWYGEDDDMTFLASGIHRRLEREGVPLGSDHYWNVIDTEVRKRFPEKFEEVPEVRASEKSEKKPSTVVASATRSTSSKKVKLTQTQLALAKKFNLSPEQYAMELTKLESQNG